MPRGIAFHALNVVLFMGTAAAQTVDFQKDVHPVLESRCRMCHVGDDAQAGLRVDSREALLRGGKTGPGILPGKSAESLLMRKVKGQAGLRMPPSGPPLTDDVIAVLGKWIDAGAPWSANATPKDALAPIAPRNPALPAGTSQHPVDRLVSAYLTKKGIRGPGVVSDALFARRVYLDLWGLLPTPEQLAEFERDSRPDKRAALVDRVLAGKENYAEHWMSFWNDLLRNDEGVAYHGERKTITEWLLRALETNMRYDSMVVALLNPVSKGDPEGFLTGVTWRGVISASQLPPMQASQNSAQVFLGMNLKCAACHDSFVNRWKLADTYGLAAMFSDDKLELVRCDVKTGRMAEARFPIPDLKVAFSESLESRRAAAAQWFTMRENGRFARTMVNRYWRQLMGRGLVEPVDDMDTAPWDADLLDWLAYDFAENGYDLKHLLRRIMTSQAYQMPAAVEKAAAKEYVFRGPQLRRLTAEQFQDAISSATGDWRVRTPRDRTHAMYTREWRLKSDPLSRALGRPIRDQVYTERSQEATTLQALEMTNGPLLSHRLERGAGALLGKLPPAPENRFDSKLLRGGSVPVDVDISGAKELWLVVEDVDSYDRSRVIAGWVNAELTGPNGATSLGELSPREPVVQREFEMKEGKGLGITASLPARLSWDLSGKGFTRFRATAAVDEASRKSDIGPAVRFFVFTEKPESERLVRIEGEPPSRLPAMQWTADRLVERLYRHLLARKPTPVESREASAILTGGASGVNADGVEDLLWALLMSPEFQFVH